MTAFIFRGTEPRQQFLLIFNTKSQGNSGGKDTLLPQIEIGNDRTFNSYLSALQCIFASLLELPKVLEKIFFLWEEWFGVAGLQRDNCTERHFIFWSIIQH